MSFGTSQAIVLSARRVPFQRRMTACSLPIGGGNPRAPAAQALCGRIRQNQLTVSLDEPDGFIAAVEDGRTRQ
jgi:hypothetical protein